MTNDSLAPFCSAAESKSLSNTTLPQRFGMCLQVQAGRPNASTTQLARKGKCSEHSTSAQAAWFHLGEELAASPKTCVQQCEVHQHSTSCFRNTCAHPSWDLRALHGILPRSVAAGGPGPRTVTPILSSRSGALPKRGTSPRAKVYAIAVENGKSLRCFGVWNTVSNAAHRRLERRYNGRNAVQNAVQRCLRQLWATRRARHGASPPSRRPAPAWAP